MQIAGWTKVSFIDFPGTIATVLFTPLCPLACPYCHNPALVDGSLSPVASDEIFSFLRKRSGLVEGVVISGGEPTIHEELPAFIDELRRLGGLKIKLDTNGLFPDMIERCAVDYLAVDLKTAPERYDELGCVFGDVDDRLGRSMGIVRRMGEHAEVRITVAPGIVDEEVIEAILPLLSGVERVWLQPCRANVPLLDPEFAKRMPVPIESIQRMKAMIEPLVGECRIRG